MKKLLIVIATLGCSSHASSAGLFDDGAAGAAGSTGTGGALQVDADITDRIVDVYEAATADSPTYGDAALPPGGQCPVLLAVPCEATSCSNTCACNSYTHWECVTETSSAGTSTHCSCSGIDD